VAGAGAGRSHLRRMVYRLDESQQRRKDRATLGFVPDTGGDCAAA
jgi:hypothetical protein